MSSCYGFALACMIAPVMPRHTMLNRRCEANGQCGQWQSPTRHSQAALHRRGVCSNKQTWLILTKRKSESQVERPAAAATSLSAAGWMQMQSSSPTCTGTFFLPWWIHTYSIPFVSRRPNPKFYRSFLLLPLFGWSESPTPCCSEF